MRMCKPQTAIVFAFSWLVLCAQAGAFQTGVDHLQEHQRAVIAFDLRIDKIMSYEVMQSESAKQFIDGNNFPGPWGGLKLSKIERIFGAASLAESIDVFSQYEPGQPSPVEVVVRFKFYDSAAADDMFQAFAESPLSVTFEEAGKTYVRPTDEFLNLRMHLMDSTTLEMATQAYLMQNIDEISTEGLNAAWDGLGDEAIRVAIDLEGRRDFMEGLVELGKSQVPPMATGFVELINKVEYLQLSADLEADELLRVVAKSGDETQSAELNGGLNMIFEMAKVGGNQWLQQSHTPDSPDVRLVRDLLNQLGAKQDGDQVSVHITRPEVLDEFLLGAFERMVYAQRNAEEMNRGRQFALSIMNYESASRRFPISDDDDLSWRVKILPYLDEQALYREFAIDEAWDSDVNKPLAEQMPAIFGGDGKTTNIRWIKPDTLPTSYRDILDGSSNTIMLLQTPGEVPWTQANDLTIDEAIEMFDQLDEGESLIAVFYDGSVRRVEASIDRTVLRNLLDPQDGNIIDW